ncbi:MAG: hypothetical protein CM1200mP3_12000 [Chloroflexota bacterium]|nr:MAG: hypothetical protein CM1200mP3_12000 [Chloroflexota bacterium]
MGYNCLSNKALNRNSNFPAILREPGKLRTGVCAESEWTWELLLLTYFGLVSGRIGPVIVA